MVVKESMSSTAIRITDTMKACRGVDTAMSYNKNKKNGLQVKKCSKKFGGFQESHYLCTRNSEMMRNLMLQ